MDLSDEDGTEFGGRIKCEPGVEMSDEDGPDGGEWLT